MSTISQEYGIEPEREVISGLNIERFLRKRWLGKGAKEKWGKKLINVQKDYQKLELETVVAGIRKCTTLNVEPDNLGEKTAQLAEKGLYFQPIRKIGASAGVGAFRSTEEAENWKYYGAVSSTIEGLEEFVEASANPPDVDNREPADPIKLGELLGYPECCTRAYYEEFMKKEHDYPFWQIACNTGEKFARKVSENKIVLEGIPWELNVFLRCKQLKITPQLPCSLDCEKSLETAREWFELGKSLGLGMDSLKEILSLTVEWRASKGVANIKTPDFEFQTHSQPCWPQAVVKISNNGTIYS